MAEDSTPPEPGFWRNASRHMSVFGIPAVLFLLYLFWFRFPSWTTIYVISTVIAAFKVLSMIGWTLNVLIARAIYLFRGTRLSGRPWWYRRFTDKD